jgi:hypothetical protein
LVLSALLLHRLRNAGDFFMFLFFGVGFVSPLPSSPAGAGDPAQDASGSFLRRRMRRSLRMDALLSLVFSFLGFGFCFLLRLFIVWCACVRVSCVRALVCMVPSFWFFLFL